LFGIITNQPRKPVENWKPIWAKRLARYLIGSSEDIVRRLRQVCFHLAEGGFLLIIGIFAYEASQGRFELAISKQNLKFIDYWILP